MRHAGDEMHDWCDLDTAARCEGAVKTRWTGISLTYAVRLGLMSPHFLLWQYMLNLNQENSEDIQRLG